MAWYAALVRRWQGAVAVEAWFRSLRVMSWHDRHQNKTDNYKNACVKYQMTACSLGEEF